MSQMVQLLFRVWANLEMAVCLLKSKAWVEILSDD